MSQVHRSTNVLIVDDNPFDLKLLARHLSNAGCSSVVTFERATAALDALQRPEGHPDLILCDLSMPEMDGVEFVRNLVDLGFEGGIALVSGEDMRVVRAVEALAREQSLWVLGALQKPVSAERVDRLLQRHREAPPMKTPFPQVEYGADDVCRAIERRELFNVYQPVLEMECARVVAVETLVRWQHPSDGLVFPDQFVAVAESNGLIDSLTEAVLTEAVEQSSAWRNQGLELEIAVNVSMDNLVNLHFPDSVATLVAERGVPMSSVVLEVTESRLMTNRAAALDILSRLRLKQVGLSIDDFGTGYSSLSQLRDMPFDELKIDREFVHGAHSNGNLGAIVTASLGIASKLGLRTVAEGVEDQDDWAFLRGQGCSRAQGYFIARPMAGDAVPGWCAEWERTHASRLVGDGADRGRSVDN